jgi:uncharacterized protein
VRLEQEEVPETTWGLMNPREMIDYGYAPSATCGLGQNLYVEPDGRSYPCYTWHGEQWYMGSIIKDGLEAVVNSRRFTELREHTVNTNLICKQCALRYLCGGVCRAWDRLPASLQTDLDAPPMNCSNQKNRARLIFLNALERLNVTEEMWSAVGFPLICDL